MNFEGKKLLILGANPETIPLVEVANKMGIYTIVTDYNPNAPAKKYSRKSYNIDGMDVDSLVDMAIAEHVDGVLVGVADMLLKPYQQVCERLGFPCYLTKEIVAIFNNKDTFKRTCEFYNVEGIPEYHITTEMKDEDISRIDFPVLVKPVDNASGTGMTICNKVEELKKGINIALANSKCKQYLIEKYMTCDDMFVYYTFKNGECYLSAIADRFTSKEQGNVSPVCLGAVYPSKYQNLYYDTMHDKMCEMFKNVGVKDGVLLIQAFVEDGHIYVYDPGFRLQGEAPHLLIQAINGFDQREMLIRFALSGNMGEPYLIKKNDSNFQGKAAGSIWILLKKGTIRQISGMDELGKDPEIVSIVQRFYQGDEVTDAMIGTEKQVFARLYLVCETQDDYKKKVIDIESKLKIYDTNGENMIVAPLNSDLLWK